MPKPLPENSAVTVQDGRVVLDTKGKIEFNTLDELDAHIAAMLTCRNLAFPDSPSFYRNFVKRK